MGNILGKQAGIAGGAALRQYGLFLGVRPSVCQRSSHRNELKPLERRREGAETRKAKWNERDR